MTTTTRLAEQAAQLRALHHAAEPLVLPNAWDATSAIAVQQAGFPAVATTSSGVSAALGFEDGQRMPADEVFSSVARIARVLDVPLTADLEAGYGLSADAFIGRMLSAGAVGCNLEDTDHSNKSLRDADRQAEWLAAGKNAGRKGGGGNVVHTPRGAFRRRPTRNPANIRATV